MRILFLKVTLAWPRSSGHDVHCFYMMQALARLGHEVSLITAHDPAPGALDGLPLAFRRTFRAPEETQTGPAHMSRLQERFRCYWGIDMARIHAVADTAEEVKADAVIVVGLNVLPYLAAIKKCMRIWYAADEWAWHHLSQTRMLRPSTWRELKQALVKGLYERAYRGLVDRVWVVTERDRWAMRLVAGMQNVDVIANGVDGDHYRPVEASQVERSCTFWGRLDFGPNIQALDWFCRRVWPLVRRQIPNCRFTIYGFNPSEAVRAMAGHDGIELVPDLPDLRVEIARHQAVVLPFVSGGGIKNKLLEAASMGKPIVCTDHACGGLRLEADAPMLIARRSEQWATHLRTLWCNPSTRNELGAKARRWVLSHHTWRTAAATAASGLQESLGKVRR